MPRHNEIHIRVMAKQALWARLHKDPRWDLLVLQLVLRMGLSRGAVESKIEALATA